MNESRPRRLPGLARKLYRRSRALRRARSENRLQPRLRVDSDAPELVLSPHWDDAVLDCWSLLSSGRELTVVNVFAGVPPPGRAGVWESVSGARDSAERARRRIAEDTRALALAGRAPLSLALLDAKYRQTPSALDVDELDRALSAAVQSASHVYVPAGIGAHADHLLARRYGRLLLRAGMPVTLYAELPYCIFHGWPSWVDGREPEPNRNVEAYWLSFLERVPEMPPLRSAYVERMDGPTAAAKLEAIRCYETSLNYGIRCLLADPAFHGFEVRWQLVGPTGDAAQTMTPGRAADGGAGPTTGD
ncbi:MAG: PIG-L family deacetylase [Solirubrobacteraceae bacterium]